MGFGGEREREEHREMERDRGGIVCLLAETLRLLHDLKAANVMLAREVAAISKKLDDLNVSGLTPEQLAKLTTETAKLRDTTSKLETATNNPEGE